MRPGRRGPASSWCRSLIKNNKLREIHGCSLSSHCSHTSSPSQTCQQSYLQPPRRNRHPRVLETRSPFLSSPPPLPPPPLLRPCPPAALQISSFLSTTRRTNLPRDSWARTEEEGTRPQSSSQRRRCGLVSPLPGLRCAPSCLGTLRLHQQGPAGDSGSALNARLRFRGAPR